MTFAVDPSALGGGQSDRTCQRSNCPDGPKPDAPISGTHPGPRGRIFYMPSEQQHATERKKANRKRKEGKAHVLNFLMHEDLEVEKFPNRITAPMPNY